MKENLLLKKLIKDKPFIIGMVHFGPLEGNPGSPGFDTLLNNALYDLHQLEESNFDAVIFENNYDTNHTEFLLSKTKEQFRKLISLLVNKTKLPIGISVLWNDYPTALELAKEFSLDFIRIPVFVDQIRTNYGFDVIGDPTAVLEKQTQLSADSVSLYTDIQVKHSILLNQRPIEESAREAQESGSNGLIVTGKWTGDPPTIKDLRSVREVSSLPVIIGSGVDEHNFSDLKNFADAFIVGTSIKTGVNKDPSNETNLKPWNARIDLEKAKRLISLAKK